jgi:hypothetical protein
MKNILRAFLILAAGSISVHAAQLTKEQLPEKITSHFIKKHPKAVDWVISEKKHFGQALYEINFKEDKEEVSVFYRKNGHFYVSAEKIYAFNIIPSIVINSLKAAFPDYKITAAQLVINPNAAGEEYEVTISSAGSMWTVSLDAKGNLIEKEKLAAAVLPLSSVPVAPAAPAAVAPAKK